MTNFNPKHTVLVTGFGPFGNHAVNASWEAVKELQKLSTNSKELHNVQVLAKEIPVSYDHVSTYIPKLWKEHNPIIVLHVGVSHKAECLTIEHHAHSIGYVRLDIERKCPDETRIAPNVFNTHIDVENICDAVNKNSEYTGCKACVSQDAGRYLCEYIYYHSLLIEPKRTLFIHVPDFDKYSSIQTAKGLHDVLCCIVKNYKNSKALTL